MSNCRTIDLNRYAGIFKALSNAHRLRIFNILYGCCDPDTGCSTDEMMRCCVGELDDQLDIASSTLSHHLKELNRAGLIEMHRHGKQVFCSVNTSTLAELKNFFVIETAGQPTTDIPEVPYGSETGGRYTPEST